MSSFNHKCNSSVAKHMLANQKVGGSILSQGEHSFLWSCMHLHEFLQRNDKGKHEFKTREAHEKWS